jgi:methylthioribose-1-phosphate isomerase
MALIRLLNMQGIAGIAIAAALGILLLIQKAETRHWHKQSSAFEQLYGQERAALSTTVANYRAAAQEAQAADQANAARVAAEQRSINERTSNDFEARLAAARLSAQRLREQNAAAAAAPGGSASAAVPGLSAAAGGPAEAADEDGLPRQDALTATEQAIQLDELIKWVRRQAALNANASR